MSSVPHEVVSALQRLSDLGYPLPIQTDSRTERALHDLHQIACPSALLPMPETVYANPWRWGVGTGCYRRQRAITDGKEHQCAHQ